MTTYECTCGSCGKSFRSFNKDGKTCFGCALGRFAGSGAPEEGDINSALIVSGEMSEDDARSLREDLESIDHSGEEAHWRRMIEDYDDEDGRWDYLEDPDDDREDER